MIDTIKVEYQHELDNIPKDFKGRIEILGKHIVVRDRVITMCGDSSAILKGNSFAVLCDHSEALLYDNSSASLYKSSNVVLHGHSSATLRDYSYAIMHDYSSAILYGFTHAILYGKTAAILQNYSAAILYGSATAELYGDSRATMFSDSTANLYGYSSAILHDYSSATLYGSSQVLTDAPDSNETSAVLQDNSSARILIRPQTIQQFMEFYNIKHTDTTALMYKAVHKSKETGELFSDYDYNFKYIVGEFKTETCDSNELIPCSNGINIAPLKYALSYGYDWDDLTILEVETKIDDIILPKNSEGKVRTSKIKVIREVPLEECGLYGKMKMKENQL